MLLWGLLVMPTVIWFIQTSMFIVTSTLPPSLFTRYLDKQSSRGVLTAAFILTIDVFLMWVGWLKTLSATCYMTSHAQLARG